ncbi:leucine-rich repeat domain-containing protein [Dyadobacter sediminis]|uniref:Leucine-rich repeat domain-containing protein n=2 Tax=Dyadobacter sediminis TaxID=1493691 RepID=A0A5R9KAS6_9BACT|nr:leucine-rich repeat domain-containing protein [Dyadobacter sediminis]
MLLLPQNLVVMKLILTAFLCLCIESLYAQIRVLSSENAEKQGINQAKLSNEYTGTGQNAADEILAKTNDVLAAAFPENPNPGITVFTRFYINESGSADYLIFDLQTGEGYNKDSLNELTRKAFLTGFDGWKVKKPAGTRFAIMSFKTFGKQPVMREVRSGDSSVTDLKSALVFQDTLKVKRLYLNQLDLKSVPDVIYRFPNLEELYLGRNELQSVHIQMQHLPKLKQLHLQNNQIGNNGLEITENHSLTLLNLNENKFTDIPKQLRASRKLSSLWLGGNEMNHLSNKSFRKLNSVQDLNFYKSAIPVLPKGIKKMKNLEVLDLYYNKLETLPVSITKLKKLTHLAVSHNQLTSLPKKIDRLSKVHTLYAHHNHISKLPARIAKMQNLKILDLGFNWFTDFPKELTAFFNLQELDLSSNNFLTFPEQLLEIKQLDKLYLRGNPFVKDDAEIKYSQQLGQLKNRNIEVYY